MRNPYTPRPWRNRAARGMSTRRTLEASVIAVGLAVIGAGCNSIMNGWLDPSVLGSFNKARTLEIRTTLTIEDTPRGIPGAVYPTKEDLEVRPVEFPISAGDALRVDIWSLLRRNMPSENQVQVSPTGLINLPVVGWVKAEGFTVQDFEVRLIEHLREQEILLDPQVTVVPVYLQKSTFSIFGIGASAATNSPLRAGTFQIRRPGLRVLEAINQVGGLSEMVTDIYVFRYDQPEILVGLPVAEGDIAAVRMDIGEDDSETSQKAEEPDQLGQETRIEESDKNPNGEVEVLIDTDMDDSETESSDAPSESELIEAIVSGDEGPPPPQEVDVPADLHVEPVQPWIWINNEFVRNPTYEESPEVPESRAEPSGVFEGPTVNWARVAGESTFRVIRIPAESLRGGDPEFDIVVRSGDVIRILSGEIGIYYVMGQVVRPGAFGFNAEEITLKRAIALANGLAPLAWPDRCTIYRRIGQREQMIQVNLDRIFAGKDPDFLIRRGDIINVGTHPLAPFLQRIRAWTLPTPASNVGYSFTYSRNFADIDSFGGKRNPHNEPDTFPGLFP